MRRGNRLTEVRLENGRENECCSDDDVRHRAADVKICPRPIFHEIRLSLNNRHVERADFIIPGRSTLSQSGRVSINPRSITLPRRRKASGKFYQSRRRYARAALKPSAITHSTNHRQIRS